MKKYFLILTIALSTWACSHKQQSTQSFIAVSIAPQKYIIDQIAQQPLDVVVMVTPGSSPATYAPTPKQVEQLAKAFLYIKVGHLGYEQTWLPKIKNIHNELTIIDSSKGIDLIAGMTEQHGDHVHLHGIDPHHWMAPNTFSIMAKNTFDALCRQFPSRVDEFKKGYIKLKEKIKRVDEHAKNKLSHKTKRTFMIFHPALGYFARQYGLEQVSLELDGKEPSAKHMKYVIDEAKNHNIKAIFIQKEFSKEQAESVANEIKGEVIEINPLSYEWTMQMEHIILHLSNVLN